MSPEWVGWVLLGVATAAVGMLFGMLIGALCSDRQIKILRSQRDKWIGDEAEMRGEWQRERDAHEATTLRCSDAEARLAQISLLAAPKAE